MVNNLKVKKGVSFDSEIMHFIELQKKHTENVSDVVNRLIKTCIDNDTNNNATEIKTQDSKEALELIKIFITAFSSLDPDYQKIIMSEHFSHNGSRNTLGKYMKQLFGGK